MKKFISFSGGVESTTMCALYGKGATAIWSDTGAEHKAMYERIDLVEQRMIDLHDGDFKLVRLKGSYPYHGERFDSLEETISKIKYMPSSQRRYCTGWFKIKPIDDYLKSQGECELMIGFNFDEEGRTGNMEAMSNVTYTYPLIDEAMTRSDCESYLRLNLLHLDLPVYMQRGGCRMCFFKSKKEYKALYHLNKKEFLEVLELEEKMQDKQKKFRSIMQTGQSLRELAIECENEIKFMPEQDWADLYKSIKVETSCGAFCHR